MSRFRCDEIVRYLPNEVDRVAKIGKKKTVMAMVYVASWSEMMYEIWLRRCMIVY